MSVSVIADSPVMTTTPTRMTSGLKRRRASMIRNPEAGLRAHELAGNHERVGERGRHAERPDQLGDHGGYDDGSEKLVLGGAKGFARAQEDRRHVAHGFQSADHDDGEDTQRDQEQLARLGDAEPHEEERDHGDDRHRADALDQRVEEVEHLSVVGHLKAQPDAEKRAQREAHQDADHRHRHVFGQKVADAPDRLDHLGGRGEHDRPHESEAIFRDGEPDAEPERDGDQAEIAACPPETGASRAGRDSALCTGGDLFPVGPAIPFFGLVHDAAASTSTLKDFSFSRSSVLRATNRALPLIDMSLF